MIMRFTRYFYILAASIPTILVLFVVYTKSQQEHDDEAVSDIIPGTKLKRVAEYKPLRIRIYADPASTNKFPDYAVYEGCELVFLRENTPSNTVMRAHSENGLPILTTVSDEKERVLRRQVDFDLGGKLKYIYLDKDGDGLFDKFANFDTNGLVSAAYERSNLCWIPMTTNAKTVR